MKKVDEASRSKPEESYEIILYSFAIKIYVNFVRLGYQLFSPYESSGKVEALTTHRVKSQPQHLCLYRSSETTSFTYLIFLYLRANAKAIFKRILSCLPASKIISRAKPLRRSKIDLTVSRLQNTAAVMKMVNQALQNVPLTSPVARAVTVMDAAA
jgi:hypothetical protein